MFSFEYRNVWPFGGFAQTFDVLYQFARCNPIFYNLLKKLVLYCVCVHLILLYFLPKNIDLIKSCVNIVQHKEKNLLFNRAYGFRKYMTVCGFKVIFFWNLQKRVWRIKDLLVEKLLIYILKSTALKIKFTVHRKYYYKRQWTVIKCLKKSTEILNSA